MSEETKSPTPPPPENKALDNPLPAPRNDGTVEGGVVEIRLISPPNDGVFPMSQLGIRGGKTKENEST